MMIREFTAGDVPQMREIWNEVVAAGDAFPQEEPLRSGEAEAFFAGQTRSAVAVEESTGRIAGLYILHPNNVGRCGHICNASYAVSSDFRGKKIGKALVRDCLSAAPEYGYRVLQFNAVVADNIPAIRLYEKLGFTALGTLPGGFHDRDGAYRDIILFYHTL